MRGIWVEGSLEKKDCQLSLVFSFDLRLFPATHLFYDNLEICLCVCLSFPYFDATELLCWGK